MTFDHNLYSLTEFLIESNAIEQEFSALALIDSMEAMTQIRALDRVNKDTILKIHKILMQRLRPGIAGKIRKVNVTVGGRLCPNPGEIHRLFFMWEDAHAGANTEESIKAAHVAFEKIHPFEDGNGRVGRIVMNWQRRLARLPLLIIHAGEEQQKYYSWFE